MNRNQNIASLIVLAIGILIGHYLWTPQLTNTLTSGQSSSDGTAISSLPQSVQNVLSFTPTGTSEDMANLVENFMSLNSWEGSESVPGAFKVTSGPHGASIVDWTIKATSKVDGMTGNGVQTWQPGTDVTFEFQISQDGQQLQVANGPAQAVMSYNNLG